MYFAELVEAKIRFVLVENHESGIEVARSNTSADGRYYLYHCTSVDPTYTADGVICGLRAKLVTGENLQVQYSGSIMMILPDNGA